MRCKLTGYTGAPTCSVSCHMAWGIVYVSYVSSID